jgi:GNAT superfamily N-acetyltransferase
MTEEITVREYRPEDLEQVLDLARELEAELAEQFKDVEIQSGLDDYRNRYLKPGHKYKTYVALAGDKVVGYLIGYPSLGAPEVDYTYDMLPKSLIWAPPEFFLQIAFVSKPFRNQGISKRLHLAIIDYARSQGFREVYTCIAKWNIPEIKVISALKFEVKDLGYRYRLTLKL